MTLLDTVREHRGGRTDRSVAVPVSLLSRAQRVVLVAGTIVLIVAVGALVFGPGRGLRTDIASVSNDLDASRDGIFSTLETGRATLTEVRSQLEITEQSLTIQEQGLQIAVGSQRIAETTAQDTEAILAQTTATLQTVHEVVAALGPLEQLDESLDTLVSSVEAGVQLGRTTLQIAEQTLATGQQALAVARETLTTLQRSEDLQRQLLEVAQRTLEQTEQINAKTPGAPVFPTP